MTTAAAYDPSKGTGLSSSETRNSEPLDLASSRAAKEQTQKIISWTQNQFRAIRNARSTQERQWYLNMAFFFGKQNVIPIRPQATGNTGAIRLYTPPAPPWRSRPVINRIRPTIRTELSQLTANRPSAMVVPASAEDRDMYAAMAGEQVWESIYIDARVKAVIRRAMWWTLVCGTGFMKSYWDPRKGEMIQGPGGTMEPRGDICISHETPFHILVPDFKEQELENQPYMMHAKVMSPEAAKMMYKEKTKGINWDAGSADAQDILEDSFLNLIGTQALNKADSMLVLEVYVKPGVHPLFPEGAFYTIMGDQIIQGIEGMPYQHGMYPFAKFDHIDSGKFYTTSIIEDLVPLQKEFNRTRGQIIENKNRMAKLQLIAPRGSVDAAQITTEPGQVIFYTPGFTPPQPLPVQAIPSYVTDELDRIKEDWNDISGQHEVSHGQVPPGVTAATAISFLQERDESKLSTTFDSLEEGIEKVAKLALNYVHDYWDAERLIKVTGPDGSFDATTFKGSDLLGNTDIRVEAGSSLPVSKAAKQALLMDLMKMGFIPPQEGLKYMDMGGINKLYDQFQTDNRQVQRENLRMSKVTAELMEEYNQANLETLQQDPTAFDGQEPPLIVPVNTWDNHKLHIDIHNNYRKGQAFEMLPLEVKALFEAHVKQHIMALGLESETMNPRNAAGLPPDPLADEEESPDDGGGQPGPEPMPQGMEGSPV